MVDTAAVGSALGGTNASSQVRLAENFEMFLTLLTEQMKNQDPLSPLDSTQFVDQLVSFSSVEQQIASNQNLESLLVIQSAAAQGAAIGFMGRMATVNSPQTALTGGQAEWGYTLPDQAAESQLVIRDATGRVVARLEGETGPGRHTLAWDGTDGSGNSLADGLYSLTVDATNANGETMSSTVSSTSRVTGVDLSGSEVVIEMGQLRVPLSSVRALREAATA